MVAREIEDGFAEKTMKPGADLWVSSQGRRRELRFSRPNRRDVFELGCSNISENRTRLGRAGGRKLVDFREREAGRGSHQEKGPERDLHQE